MSKIRLIYECPEYKLHIEHVHEVDPDSTLDELEILGMIRSYLLAMGYSTKHVDELLGT